MSELVRFESRIGANCESEIKLARKFPVSVLITAAAERALAIAHAIAGPGEMGRPAVTMFDGAAILDAANRERWGAAGTGDAGDLVIRDIHRLTSAEQTALMALLDTGRQPGSRRIISAAHACLFDRVQDGTFMRELYYRLNVIHIVSDPCGEGRPAFPGPIIAE
jgi:transcriptional regulator of acetoin/glycerol metabolism